MTRNELKRIWLNIDYSNVKEKKEVIVDLRHIKSKWWPGYGYVTTKREGPDGFSEYSTHEKHPMKYALETEEYKSGEYELVIKE